MNSRLPEAGFAALFKVPIDIEEIYIPLRAMVNLRGVDDIQCYSDALEAEKHCGEGLEISMIRAFPKAEKRGRKGLVVLGDPGSGKTTCMKRIMLWCLRKGAETLELPKGMLPVFLPLRELKSLDHGLDRFIQD